MKTTTASHRNAHYWAKTTSEEATEALGRHRGATSAPCGYEPHHPTPSAVARSATRRGEGERSEPLNLIEGHLTDNPRPISYKPATQAARLMKGWAFPDTDGKVPMEFDPDKGRYRQPKSPQRYVLKIQPFEEGGYEATLRLLDIDKIANAIDRAGKKRGQREESRAKDPEETAARAGARAKAKVRKLCRNMCATHMVTLTKREKADAPETWASLDQWACDWDKFRRGMEKILGGKFPYVAVIERHQKGNFHLHVAWCGRIPAKQAWHLWNGICGGGRGKDSSGGCQPKHIKVPRGGDRSYRIACYISKYVTKTFETDQRFNKKRYWSSKQSLPEVRRYVMAAADLNGAMDEMRGLLGLDWSKFSRVGIKDGVQTLIPSHMFMFGGHGGPGESFGLWLSFIPELHGTEVPF